MTFPHRITPTLNNKTLVQKDTITHENRAENPLETLHDRKKVGNGIHHQNHP